ncbi:hypothetical protein AFLA_008102 [Aspergillus flavus NRRL3357]|nr:hypothetical protein AFLA_008102 [Aspergillus flavus NRRL3357]
METSIQPLVAINFTAHEARTKGTSLTSGCKVLLFLKADAADVAYSAENLALIGGSGDNHLVACLDIGKYGGHLQGGGAGRDNQCSSVISSHELLQPLFTQPGIFPLAGKVVQSRMDSIVGCTI